VKHVRLKLDGRPIARCVVADTSFARLRGLIGRKRLQPGEGMLIIPTAAIHTCFMRHPIDAIFCDRDLRVVRIAARLEPWRAAASRGSHAVLELASGECDRNEIRVGSELILA
jgi:uncharacterized protein